MSILHEADELRKIRDEAYPEPERPDWHARLVRKDYAGVSVGLAADIDSALDRIVALEVELEWVLDVLRRHRADHVRVLGSVAALLQRTK